MIFVSSLKGTTINQKIYIFNKDEFNSVIYEAKLCQNKNEITEKNFQFFIEFLAVSLISST